MQRKIHGIITSLCVCLAIAALIVLNFDKADKVALVSILVVTGILGVVDAVEARYGR